MKPKISVIMAAYNEEKYIKRAIESILSQTFRDFEFIIVDDNSSDNTLRIIEKYMEKDNRIHPIKNKENMGRALSRNKGLKVANGKYIAIQDADDYSDKRRFEKQVTFLEQNKDYFLVGTNRYLIREGNLSKSFCYTSWKRIRNRLPKGNCFSHSSIMFRNKSIRYNSLFEPSEDYELYLRMWKRGLKMCNLPERLCYIRTGHNSLGEIKEMAIRRTLAQLVHGCITPDEFSKRYHHYVGFRLKKRKDPRAILEYIKAIM